MADRPEGEEVRGVPHQLPEHQEAAPCVLLPPRPEQQGQVGAEQQEQLEPAL